MVISSKIPKYLRRNSLPSIRAKEKSKIFWRPIARFICHLMTMSRYILSRTLCLVKKRWSVQKWWKPFISHSKLVISFNKYLFRILEIIYLPFVWFLLLRYEGLGIKDILKFLTEKHPEVFDYLPEKDLELPKTPKQWVCNIVASVLGERFNKWVAKQVDARH